MKRASKIIFSCICFFLSGYVYADTFNVEVVSGGKSNTILGSYDNYNKAKEVMNNYASNDQNVAVIYKNGKVINAKYAVTRFTYDKSNPAGGGASNIHRLFSTPTATTPYTTVAAAYGLDSAFLDYDYEHDRVKIKISGYTGWINAPYIDIIPLSSTSVKIESNTSITVRKDHSTNSDALGSVSKGNIYTYLDTYNDGTYTWYKIKYNGSDAWFASKDESWAKVVNNSIQTYYEHYAATGNLIHYYNNHWGQSYTNLGPAPKFLNKGVIYYSFDGIYFYTNYRTMIDDYRKSSHANAVNSSNPHYAYYLYLPNHSKTAYTADDFNQIIKNYGYNSKSESVLYGEGASFIESQNVYGVNALLTFSAALNESAKGTSKIAKDKNNVFGHGAYDNCAYDCATVYSSVRESILAHAKITGQGYNSPTDSRYYGGHYGNKQSGMNIMYATDPYWGEKAAMNAFLQDKNFGLQDYLANTIGIKTSSVDAPVKKSPSDSSATIYTLKNKSTSVENMPVIVMDKVNVSGTNWYKIYTDVALDANQNIASDGKYSDKSFGYVKESYLYVSNHQPTIIANNKDITVGTNVNLLDGVTAKDDEDGNLTSKIKVSSNINPKVAGTYTATYTVTDESNFSVSKEIKINVVGTTPEIKAENKETLQFRNVNLLENVTAYDEKDKDLTSKIEIKQNNVNVNVVGTYKVIYTVKNSYGISKDREITVTVKENHKPVINVTTKSIILNSTFDPMNGVSANDAEDGDITKKVKVTKNTVDSSKIGTYKVTYEVEDSDKQKVSITATYEVTEKKLIQKEGEFYLNELSWNNTTKKYTISGYLIALGIDNKANNTTYELILQDKNSDKKFNIGINSWTKNVPFALGKENGYDYNESWFKGELTLDNIPSGDYDIYMKAIKGDYYTEELVNNLFNKSIDRRAIDNTNGYNFKVILSLKSKKIELNVRKGGLITKTTAPTFRNMINDYDNIEFKDNKLHLVGTSYNYGGTYDKKENITRKIIFENTKTFEQYTFDIQSTNNGSYKVTSSDQKDKSYAWYDDKIDVSSLPKGTYAIMVYTKTKDAEDYGEIMDMFGVINNASANINNKKYQVALNKSRQNRIELVIE